MNQFKRYFEIRINRYLSRREMRRSNRKLAATSRMVNAVAVIEEQLQGHQYTRQKLVQIANKARLLLYISPFYREKHRATLKAATRRIKQIDKLAKFESEHFKKQVERKAEREASALVA